MRDFVTSPRLPPLAELLAAQLSYQARLLLRTPRAVFGAVLLPLLLLALHTGDGGVAGLAVIGVLSTAYSTHTSGLVAARQAGVLKRWRAAPIPRWCWFAARICATVGVAAASGLVTVLAGVVVDGVGVDAASFVRLAVVFVAGAVAWAAIGTAVSGFIPTAEAAWPLLGATYMPLVVLSGSFGAIPGQPGWLVTLVGDLPVRPVVAAASRALDGTGPPLGFTGHELLVLVAWTAAAFLVAQRWFRWDQPS
jgi:ABC-2 type transport system permease protein